MSSRRALSLDSVGPRRKPGSPPVEYSLLLTVTLCLLAFGVVMVFSASSTTSLLGESGDGAYYLKRTLMFGAGGLLLMLLLARTGTRVVKALTGVLLAASFAGLLAVLIPGVGITASGSTRWLGAGPLQFQPAELAKLALILYAVSLLSARPKLVRELRTMTPLLAVVAVACLLVVAEPDLGTALVICLAIAALLVAAGARLTHLAILAGALGGLVLLAILIEPYRMARLTSFMSPEADPTGAGFQGLQGTIALGSGGIFGVGLGESVQKAFYLPEAHTDMIAAVIGEELGLMGITGLVSLYVLYGYAGMRTAQRAPDRYATLLAAGITSLVLVQAAVNLFAVLGLAPITGVPLPFVSYGNSSLLVLLAATGILLGIARGRTKASGRAKGSRSGHGGRLRVVEGGRKPAARTGSRRRSAGAQRGTSGGESRDSRGRNSRARGAGAGRGRRAAR